MVNKKFVIIDALALAYRAYFAFINRPLSNSKGEPTSAVYGFLTQLVKVIEEQKPDYLAVAFDSKEKTFRHDKYEAYKSSREAMPYDMIPQIQRIKDLIEALNIPFYILPGYEADDIVGTAVKQAEKLGLLSFAITPDKDYFQLITEKTKVIRPGKSTDEVIVYDEQKVITELGFEPKYMVDYLSLIGDNSDDIPGVAGIGPKSAVPLIQKYGPIEKIYKHINEIEKAGIKKKLEAGKENAFLSKDLATIHCAVPIEIDFEKTKFTNPDFDKVKEMCFELEFKALYAKLLKCYKNSSDNTEVKQEEILDSTTSFDKKNVKYHLIADEKGAKLLAEKLFKTKLFVFDTETDSLNTFEVKIAGVSFCIDPGEAYYVATNPFKDDDGLFNKDLNDRLPLDAFVKHFKKIFENKQIKKVCQNGKFDIAVLRSISIEVNNFYFDTMLASYVLDPDQKHGMDDLSEKYLSYRRKKRFLKNFRSKIKRYFKLFR
jgi:DNA polymerase-1